MKRIIQNRYILIVIMCTNALCGCTQSKVLKKAYAYSQEIIPGARHMKVVKKAFIYFETKKGTKPVIEYVQYGDTVYKTPVVFFAGLSEIKVGKTKDNNTPVTLYPAKGNTFWRIDLLLPENTMSDNSEKKTNRIVIKGVKDGLKFLIELNNDIELIPFRGV